MSTGGKFGRLRRRRNVVGATAIVAFVVVSLLTAGAASGRTASQQSGRLAAASSGVSASSSSSSSVVAAGASLLPSPGGSSQTLAPITGCGADGTIADASGFEDADGNLAIDKAGCMDWNGFSPTWTGTAPFQTGTGSTGAFSFAGATDAVNTTSDSIYAGGVKQDTVCPGTVTGKANDKADLAAMYVATERIGGQVYLFLAWERQLDTTVQSDVFVSFEFNQSGVSCGAGSPFVQRTVGDLLFDYQFQSGNSTIVAERWDGTTWQPLATPPFEAAVNLVDVTDAIRADAPATLTKFEFGEAGINLSGLSLGDNGGKACETFGSVLGGSRTSQSGDTAQLKDFVGPAPFNASNCVKPTATTTLKNAADDTTIADGSSIPFGSSVYDTTTLGNLVNGQTPTGKVQYTFFTNGDCSGTGTSAGLVTLANDGSVPKSDTKGPLSAGSYSFEAQYLSGDDPHYSDSDVSACEPFTVLKKSPSVSTVLSETTGNVGDSVHDSATLNGATADASGTISYAVYSDNQCSVLVADLTPADNTVVNGVAPDSLSHTFDSAGTFYFQATYSGDNNNAGPVSSPCLSEQLVINAAAIKIVKTADKASVNVGSPIGFTLTVFNTGSGDAHGVTLSDPLPTNPGLSWTIASQGAGWAGSCAIAAGKLTCGGANGVTVPHGTTQAASTFTVHVTSPTTGATGGDCPTTGVVNNTGHVTTTNDGSGDSSASVCVQAMVDLAITKAGSPATQTLGESNITWTMVVTNNGPSTATGVKITDPMPTGNTFVSVTTTKGTCTGGAILTCNLGTMAAGESVTITLVTTPTQAGVQTNTAAVSGDRPETNTANNQATATVEVVAFTPPKPCVAVSRVTPKQLFVGRKTTLTIHVTQGGKAVKGIHVRITGPKTNIRTGASNSAGAIKQTLKMKKAGVLVFTPIASKACNTKRVGVTNVFTPPVTG